jgi:hypothetical protein
MYLGMAGVSWYRTAYVSKRRIGLVRCVECLATIESKEPAFVDASSGYGWIRSRHYYHLWCSKGIQTKLRAKSARSG